MELIMQKRSGDQVAGAIRMHRMYPEFKEAAILLVRSKDEGVQEAFGRMYQFYEAPSVDLAHGVPEDLAAVGTCRMEDGGVFISIGAGSAKSGLRFRLRWESVSTSWHRTAVAKQSIWMALLDFRGHLPDAPDPESMQALMPALPVLPVLRLGVLL